jgi:FtsP/CotA-like multicopper oxidase with cupredoxin domain
MQLIKSSLAFAAALLISGVSSAPHASPLGKRCTNSATDRSCWSDSFDLSTNYYDEVPDTGNTVEVWLELVNTTASLDGVSRDVLLVNGSFPGPTIIADWGDTVIVHLYNGLTNNGTGLHFHGRIMTQSILKH